MTEIWDWIQTYTGKAVRPAALSIGDVDILDIAHALSNQCRYGGHCRRFYSVAEHCVLLSYKVPKVDRLHALLHDAQEAYIIDVPRPLKPLLTGYSTIEQYVADVIGIAFVLPQTVPASIVDADNRILMDERMQNLAAPPKPWALELEPLGVELQFWTPNVAEAMFLARFRKLTEGSNWLEIIAQREKIYAEPPAEQTCEFCARRGPYEIAACDDWRCGVRP